MSAGTAAHGEAWCPGSGQVAVTAESDGTRTRTYGRCPECAYATAGLREAATARLPVHSAVNAYVCGWCRKAPVAHWTEWCGACAAAWHASWVAAGEPYPNPYRKLDPR